MHRIFSFFFFLCLVQQGFSQLVNQVKPSISASTRQFIYELNHGKFKEHGLPTQFVYNRSVQGDILVNAFIKIGPGFQEESLKALGCLVGTKAGDIRTVRIPVSRVASLTDLPGLLAIDMDQPAAADLDSARRRTRIDSVHLGLGLPKAFNGDSVVVGIVDAGFDYTHPVFYDTAFSHYRVRRVWEQKGSGTPPTAFGYGAEYADSASILAKQYDITETIHGTHVGGIAGGSGYNGPTGNHNKFRGVAYKSDLVFVGMYPSPEYWLSTGMADMLDGVNYTFQYAASVGKPAVANLSWGCPLGPRDGNGLFSQAMDNLTGPGRIFVLSGGNNGQNKIHISKTFTPQDTVLSTFTTFSTSLNPKINKVDFWGDSGKTFQVQFTLYNGGSFYAGTEWIGLDDSTRLIPLVGTNGDTLFVTVTGVANEFNGKPHFLAQFLNRVPDRVGINVKASNGTVHAWQGVVVKTSGYYGAFSKYTFTWAKDGDALFTTGDLVSTRSGIAVAAYNTKVNFTNISGQALSYTGYLRGRIAGFSSVGPTADNRVKPDIAGPGLSLASSVSSYDPDYLLGGASYDNIVAEFVSPLNNRTYGFGMAAGTSMSSPLTSGVIALLLQINPSLSPQEIKDLLSKTAIKDAYTGVIPAGGSNTWGKGKVNAMGAIRELLSPTTGIVHSISNPQGILVYPNPGNGHYFLDWADIPKGEEINLTVMDALGRQVKSFSCHADGNPISLDLLGVKPGQYFIRLVSKNESAFIRLINK